MSEEDAGPGSDATTYRQVRYTAPPTATEIVLVRHGESIAADPLKPFPLLDGHGDPELAPEGREQAERIGQQLASDGRAVDAIYVTTLRRTAETAAPLAARLGLVPIVEPGLREVYLGEWEGGLYRRHVMERHPTAIQMIEAERWDVVPGAESNEALAERVTAAIRRIADAHPGRRVVAVAHGGVIGMVLSLATGSRPFTFVGSDNGSISTIFVIGDRLVLRSFNETQHLWRAPAAAAAER